MHASAQGVALLSAGGAVEGDPHVVDPQPVEIQEHGQKMSGPAPEDPEELVVCRGLVELVFFRDHDRLSPEGGDGPVRDPNGCRAAIEGPRDLREVARSDESLGTEYQLLATTPERQTRLRAERNHDVREAVEEIELVDIRRRPAALKVAVEGERTLALGEHPEVRAHVNVGAQSVPRQEVPIGLLGLGGAEQVLAVVLSALADLPSEGQPHRLVGCERDKLQAVPKVVGPAQVDPSEH